MFTETFLPATDGIVTRLCATLNHLAEQGHEVLLFAPEGAPERYASATIVGVPGFRFFLYQDKTFALPRPGLGKHIRAFQPDLIHMLNPAFIGIGAIYYAWRYQLPLVASYHTNVPTYARHYKMDFLEPLLWWYFRSLHSFAELNLCTSNATLNELAVQGFKNLHMWDRGVDTELYSNTPASDAMRQRLAPGIRENEKLLLFVGRVAAEKGLERLRPCLDQRPDVHLAIVGDGPYRAEIERAFAGSNTTFTGFLHGAELAQAYASSDGFVFPSVTETLGLVLFEAMASGLPIMAADSPPSREVLENGEAGVMFDAHDTNDMLRAMDQIFRDTETKMRITKRGHEIADGLDWRHSTVQLTNYYNQVFQTVVKRGFDVSSV